MKVIKYFLTLILFFSPSLFAKDIIRITNGEWPPYLSKVLPHNGFASHLVKEVFAAVHVEVLYGFFPWKRSYRYAKEGKGVSNSDIWNGSIVFRSNNF
jgi:polar amino acid transport system substrate-binding protein